jgi:hypothetical protein
MSLRSRVFALENRVGGTNKAMGIVRIHGGIPQPLNATAAEHRWECGPEESEETFTSRVVAAAAELGEFNVAIAGMKGAKGHAPKSWAPADFTPENSIQAEIL